MASDDKRILVRMAWLGAFILMLAAGIFLSEYNKIRNVLDLDTLPPEILMVYNLAMAALAMAVAALMLITLRR